uniref:Tail assembly chaperone n=1 Tax=viral metagenome TaxID=1070528 RepID=A0A6M3LTE2_9ZZZZ
MQLGRDALLNATVLPYEAVDIPELGGTVIVQGMTAGQRDSFESSLFKGRGRKRDVNMQDMRARLLVHCLVDVPGGSLLFTQADVPQLTKMRVDVVQRLFNVAQKLCGLSDEDVDELGKGSETEAIH